MDFEGSVGIVWLLSVLVVIGALLWTFAKKVK